MKKSSEKLLFYYWFLLLVFIFSGKNTYQTEKKKITYEQVILYIISNK